MCMGGGGGGGTSPAQIAMQNQQLQVQQDVAQQQLAEQQREFAIQQQQSAQALADTRAQQAQAQAEADRQAALTNTWQTGRAANLAQATDSINQAFSRFTPQYYQQYAQDWVNHYNPQIQDQFNTATVNTDYGLARTGNLRSQTAADQNMALLKQQGVAQADVANQAIQAANTLQQNVAGAKQNLMSAATSDATLGSPVTPGSADAIQANFNNTANALQQIKNQAGDTITTLQATPNYSSLGSIFGSLASAGSSAVQGNNAYSNLQAFQQGLGGGTGSTSRSSRIY